MPRKAERNQEWFDRCDNTLCVNPTVSQLREVGLQPGNQDPHPQETNQVPAHQYPRHLQPRSLGVAATLRIRIVGRAL